MSGIVDIRQQGHEARLLRAGRPHTMSIITIIDQNSDNVACIDSDTFTPTIAPWFGDSAENLDASIREQFLDLAEIIESGQAWTDEEFGELCRFLGLTILSGTVEADIEIDADHGVDTIVVTGPESGDEIARIQLTSTEDAEPYDAALRAAGFSHFSWI